MKISKISAVTVLLFSFIPTITYAIEEGLYRTGFNYLSVLKNKDNLVKFHFMEFDDNEWETFSGYENSDGSVTFFTYDDDKNSRFNISATTKGVKAVREFCLGIDCDEGNDEVLFDLFLPDTGGSFSGLYQSLASQNLIIHQVGSRALSIDLYEDPNDVNADYGFEIISWNLVDNTLVPFNVVYTTFNDVIPFEGDISATTSGLNDVELIFDIDNCVVTADYALTCKDFEEILSARRIF